MTNLVEKYGWNSDASPQSCGYLAPAVLKQIKALGVSSVLDLGSGNGVLCDFLAKAGFSMVGVEYDQEGVNVAKERYPSIPFYCLGVQDEPETVVAEQGHFDAVVSTEVIEHLFSPHLLPKFAKKVIRPGGYLIVTTP